MVWDALLAQALAGQVLLYFDAESSWCAVQGIWCVDIEDLCAVGVGCDGQAAHCSALWPVAGLDPDDQ